MGWFWADKSGVGPTLNGLKKSDQGTSSCPVQHGKSSSQSECPVMHDGVGNGGLNPLNNMPNFLSTKRQPGQKLNLPTDRTISSIPKGEDDQSNWEYPSPQQMYNAMVRKGKIDPNTGEEIPEDAVESMVFVHNFLNEGCWEEVLEWEKPYTEQTKIQPKLLKFMGKPHEMSPRARYYQMMSKIFPKQYSGEPPFDRHDWTVLRADSMSADPDCPGYRKVRYVIDFYGGPDDEEGMPTFNLDVRPALDNLSNAKDRFVHYTKPIIEKYFDGDK